jgi:hypothetical protein
MKSLLLAVFFLPVTVFALDDSIAQVDKAACGLLVMAHGGTDAWNEAVEAAVQPLEADTPTAIAFGMADPVTLQEAVSKLEEKVSCIAVVRLFVSGASFLHQTEYLLGLRADPPRFFVTHGGHANHQGGGVTPDPLTVSGEILISQEGLMDAPMMGSILAERALEMSDRSGNESVLVIAHGPGDDAENDRWLRKLDGLADSIRTGGAFRQVKVHTLREDWEEKRAQAEEHIRAFVETVNQENRRVLVIPFRLFGFGPYDDVLDGLTYEASGMGLLPSPRITEWIHEQMVKTLDPLP